MSITVQTVVYIFLFKDFVGSDLFYTELQLHWHWTAYGR